MWRARLIRMLSEGGMGLDPKHAGDEASRALSEARRAYCRELRDRFLRGSARFLLQDQEAVGIEALESQLLEEFDLVLRFSCQVWSRTDALRFTGLEKLAQGELVFPSDSAELYTHHPQQGTSLASHRGRGKVVMVVQPAICSIRVGGAGIVRPKEHTRVLVKGQVLVEQLRDKGRVSPRSPPHGTSPPLSATSVSTTPRTAPSGDELQILPGSVFKMPRTGLPRSEDRLPDTVYRKPSADTSPTFFPEIRIQVS